MAGTRAFVEYSPLFGGSAVTVIVSANAATGLVARHKQMSANTESNFLMIILLDLNERFARTIPLVLQFPFWSHAAPAVSLLGDLLVTPAPTGPRAHLVWGMGRRPDEADEEPSDLRHRERKVERTGDAPLFAGPTARAAKAIRARVLCRYHPGQLRTSY